MCEHMTLPSDPGTVGETLEAVGFSANRATSSGVLFSFLLH